VLNLSLGLPATLSTVVDPLDQAVEAVWRAGIVVVVSAGNDGPDNGTIDSPGDDPLVITTGALDDAGTVATDDDTMATFSSVGPTSPDGWSKPDLVASGRSVVSLAAPGSTIDTGYPSAQIGSSYFAGSGTSFSTAIVSGAAALLLQAMPYLTPDQVKARLLASAAPGPVGDPFVDGHGALDVAAATDLPPVTLTQAVPLVPVPSGTTVDLSGIWSGSTWDPASWQGWSPPPEPPAPDPQAAVGAAWNGTVWDGSVWMAEAWSDWGWDSATWQGAAWDGQPWKTEAWNDCDWGQGS
jgi:serine protease AprX